ncbi:MAG: alpha/beta fold hydrolase [Gemmatimonas sp.]|jgi:proline iminopeptidase
MPFTTTTPVPLYFREDGPASAPPLLLLHGGPGAHHDYLYPQMLALAASHRVVTYDQRGGGQSKTESAEPITWRTQVDDLGLVVRELGMVPPAVTGPTVVGYSWGALLALLYAIQCTSDPTLVAPSRLVLVSPAPITRGWRDEFEQTLAERGRSDIVQRLRDALAASGLREQDMTAYRQRSFELSVAGYFADPTKATALTPFRVTGKVQQSVWQSLGAYDLTESLRAVRVPTLVVHGRQDPIPLASAQAAADALGGKMVVLDDCGHVPYVESPALLFHAIDRFLQQRA